MSDIAIRVENLSKQYRIGGPQARYKTIRESLTEAVQAPFRRLSSVVRGQSSAVSNETIWALKDVSFEVKRGEVVGIIGRNGAGKSTLLKILSRITEPTEGRAEIHGRVGSLLEVGTGFHPELTGRENITLNGAILGMKRAEIERKFDEIVDFAEIEKFIDTPVKHYSSGMYVRLAFAVAAHLEPEILLVDEVLAVGDAAFQKKCLGKMGDVAREGRTVLFVSHNMAAIEGLCPRVLVLKTGELAYDGANQEGLAYYFESLYTNSDTPLRDRKDRKGSGEIRAVDIRIFNQDGEETSHIGMSESFCVEVRSVGKLRNAIIGVLFGNVYRKQIIRGYTWEQVTDEIELTGNDVIKCHFKNFPMMHGTYDVHVWIGQQGKCVDHVENAAQITIVPKDVFGTGRTLDPLGGVAFCETSWEINGVRYQSRQDGIAVHYQK